MPFQVSRSMSGIGSPYVAEVCTLAFSRTVKTPAGVEWPGLPVEQVDTPIRMPLR